AAAPASPLALDAWIAAEAGRLTLTAATAPPLYAPAPPLLELAARARAAGAVSSGTLVGSGVPPVALTLVDGDLLLAAPAIGAGLLIVEGFLDISDAFTFTGVVAATRGVRVGSGGSLRVEGALWIGQPE